MSISCLTHNLAISFSLATLFSLNLSQVAAAGPVDPALEGLKACTGYDSTNKTCVEIVEFKLRPDENYDSVSRLVLAENPQLVVEYHSVDFERDGRLCTIVRATDFDTSTYFVEGRQLGVDDAASMRNVAREAFSQHFGKILCSKISATSEGLIIESYLDDENIGDPKSLKWISDSDGYRLKGSK